MLTSLDAVRGGLVLPDQSPYRPLDRSVMIVAFVHTRLESGSGFGCTSPILARFRVRSAVPARFSEGALAPACPCFHALERQSQGGGFAAGLGLDAMRLAWLGRGQQADHATTSIWQL